MASAARRKRELRNIALRRSGVVQPPGGDVASGQGYRGMGSYDAYGNPIHPGDAIEYARVRGKGKQLYPHVMGGKYGPRRRSMKGVSD